jgi:hypothetical protein
MMRFEKISITKKNPKMRKRIRWESSEPTIGK